MTKVYEYQVTYTVTGGYVKNLFIDARNLAQVIAVIKALRTRIEILDAQIICGSVKVQSTARLQVVAPIQYSGEKTVNEKAA